METAKIKKLTLMTNAGLVTFPPDAFIDLMATFLSGKTMDVTDTAILYFDVKKLSALEAFPLEMSKKQKSAYLDGSPVYSNALRIAVTEAGADTVQTISSGIAFSRQVVLSWPYNPIAGMDTDKLTAWVLADDGTASNIGGRFNFQCGMFQTLVNHFSYHTISNTAISYSDVTTHWAKDVIHRLSSMGILAGNAGNFRPNDVLTRAEFAKMIVLAKKLHATVETSRFADIENRDWHSVYVAARMASLMETQMAHLLRPVPKPPPWSTVF